MRSAAQSAPAERSIPGIRGRLITSSYARDGVHLLAGAEAAPAALMRALDAWWRRCEATLGPASSVRAVTDVALLPLLRLLGFDPRHRREDAASCVLQLDCGAASCVIALAVPWGASLAAVRRAALIETLSGDARWCLCSNGTSLRILDGRRTWSRDYLEFDAAILGQEPATQALLWSLARAESMSMSPAVLDRAVEQSAQYGVEVCRALGGGVLDALRLLLAAVAGRAQRRYASEVLFEHSLTVLYRILFLLFAEARGLVPLWHPLYRDRYSIEAIVDTLLRGRRYRGLWLAIQAISRIAHSGCAAGELRVTPFNGRLFSPSQATVFDRTRIDDDSLGEVVIAVSTTPRGGGRRRIAYRDLDVEQFGAVYERVLDYEPGPLPHAGPEGPPPRKSMGTAGLPSAGQVARAAGPASAVQSVPLVRTGDRRKATGTFYTPRSLTSALVRRTLEPLIAGRTATELLRLRILDPAMGSGAFLVAACRHLSGAVEDALISEGQWSAYDITADDRAGLRRQIASQCVFGVDLNPMAVQLARLSMWLATLAADKPLSFLDHHLVSGNSLVGATPADVARQPTRGGSRHRRAAPLPLLDDDTLVATLGESAGIRLKLALDPDDTPAIVRAKEQALAGLHDRDAAIGRWRRVLDLWCAGWFWDDGAPPDRGTFGALVEEVLHSRRALPPQVSTPLLRHADVLAARHGFLHWPVMFPEVFVDAAGQPLAEQGFDAVLGNPPWDMVRGDSGGEDLRRGRRDDALRLTNFVRESGVYRVETRAHANRYQLFLERAMQLVKPGGRIGLVLPAGIASDAGTAPLRHHLFERAEVDEISGFDNRAGIFPIHRSVRFVLLTCTTGRPTNQVRCRFGMTDPDELETADSSARAPLVLTRRLLARLSGNEDLGIPEFLGEADLRLCERISATVPMLSSAAGWGVQFGRELNASDDRDAFVPFSRDRWARPIVEGKQIEPFRVALDRARYQLRADCDVRARAPRRARLAYRDVASATNRLTLIAAVLPPRAVTTHTLFCLKTPLPDSAQHVLCALMNSYVANYLIRFRVNTHVTVALVSRLPVPLLSPDDREFSRLLEFARSLASGAGPVEESNAYADIQAIAAHLYGLGAADFEHVLATFPLIPRETKTRVLAFFNGYL